MIQYLGFEEWVADAQRLSDVTPKYWITAMPGGIFLRYGLSKKGVPSLHNPEGCNQSRVLWPQIIYLCFYGKEKMRFDFDREG